MYLRLFAMRQACQTFSLISTTQGYLRDYRHVTSINSILLKILGSSKQYIFYVQFITELSPPEVTFILKIASIKYVYRGNLTYQTKKRIRQFLEVDRKG